MLYRPIKISVASPYYGDQINLSESSRCNCIVDSRMLSARISPSAIPIPRASSYESLQSEVSKCFSKVRFNHTCAAMI